MSGRTCDVKDCPREATHSLEVEWGPIYLCCECCHGAKPAAEVMLGSKDKCPLVAA